MKKFHQQRKGSTDTSKDQLIIYGRHAVISALKNPRRKIQKAADFGRKSHRS